MNVLRIDEVKHGPHEGWLEFKLRVDWKDKRGIRDIEFTYNPEDDAPLTLALKQHIVPKLNPAEILPNG